MKKPIFALLIGSALLLSSCKLTVSNDNANSKTAEKLETDAPVSSSQTAAETEETTTEADLPDVPDYSLGSTITFDGMEITFGESYSKVTLENQFSKLDGKTCVRVPVTVKNKSGATDSLNMFYVSYFNASGVKGESVEFYFDDGDDIYSDLRDGASVEGAVYMLYDGVGEYYIAFENFSETVEVGFDIK